MVIQIESLSRTSSTVHRIWYPHPASVPTAGQHVARTIPNCWFIWQDSYWTRAGPKVYHSISACWPARDEPLNLSTSHFLVRSWDLNATELNLKIKERRFQDGCSAAPLLVDPPRLPRKGLSRLSFGGHTSAELWGLVLKVISVSNFTQFRTATWKCLATFHRLPSKTHSLSLLATPPPHPFKAGNRTPENPPDPADPTAVLLHDASRPQDGMTSRKYQWKHLSRPVRFNHPSIWCSKSNLPCRKTHVILEKAKGFK